MIRVLITDDSSTVRKLITRTLNADPDIEIVGTASDGKEALRLAQELHPDVIIMDIDMPRMNGVDATRGIMEQGTEKPVIIVFSGYTEEHADLALQCLEAGAYSCVEKPGGPDSHDIESAQKILIQEVKDASRAKKKALRQSHEWSKKKEKQASPTVCPFPILVIGSSTGGPPVVEKILSELSGTFPAAILVVQHMPAHFTLTMAKRLDELCQVKVQEAQDGEHIKPGVAFVAPGDFHMQIVMDDNNAPIIHLNQDAPVHGLRPSIDVTMLSLQGIATTKVLGVILTGMGQDGTVGLQSIKAGGGKTLAQDPITCVVDSMVETAIGCDAVDEVAKPEALARRITQIITSLV